MGLLGGATAPQLDLTWKIFEKVGYFDPGSGERNLIQFVIWFLFLYVMFCNKRPQWHGFFYNGQNLLIS